MKIDTHHHFWKYSEAEYPWMTDEIAILKNDYLPPNLHQEISAAGVDGVVTVQVRQELKENDWMLEMAEANEWILGVVGWGPLHEENVGEQLAPYAENKYFKGIRHVIQDEPDDEFILGKEFNRGIAQLKELNLVYDILIFERQLAAAIKCVDQHPEQAFVLDHIAKPRIGDGAMDPWAAQMHDLAKRPNVTCKLSGLTTEADHKNWTEAELLPYMDVAFEAFGADRMMFGSDWPVALLAGNYGQWHDIVSSYVGKLRPDEQENFWHKNAVKAYAL